MAILIDELKHSDVALRLNSMRQLGVIGEQPGWRLERLFKTRVLSFVSARLEKHDARFSLLDVSC